MAIVLLQEPCALDESRLGAALASLPQAAKARLRSVQEQGDGDGGAKASVALDDIVCAVSLVHEPLGADDFRTPLAQAGEDSDLARAVETHSAYVMVLCRMPDVVMERAVMGAAAVHLVAHAVAGAVAGPAGPSAALWVASGQAVLWAQFAQDAQALRAVYEGTPAFPARFWSTVQLVRRNADGAAARTGGSTKGLAPLMGYDIDLLPIAWPADDVAARLTAVVDYLLTRGPVIADGDTLGADEDERFTARFLPATGRMELTLQSVGAAAHR